MTTIFFSVDENDIAFLREEWNDLLSFYTSNPSIKDDLFRLLKNKYSEEGRFYHNLSHVKALLKLLESVHHKVQDRNAIRFAIWFHDVIYDPKRNDNEEESARLASEILGKLHVKTETLELVRDLILATKDHRGDHVSEDTKLFLDMDLAVLGMDGETYQKYSQAVRKEYSWVPELTYRRRRTEILQSFLDREMIYLTDEMKNRFEAQARKNIKAEIAFLGVP